MTKALNRAWLIVFIITAAGVFVLKTWMAFKTDGAADISVWKDFLVHVKECGVCVYETGGLMQNPGGTRLNPFNHPPFIIHFLRAVNFVSTVTGLRFETVFRLITSLVDTGSAVVLYKLLQRDELLRPWSFLLYLLAPATIIISGYHGNTDTVMIFFVLLTALLIERRGFARKVLIGLLLCAISVSSVPLWLRIIRKNNHRDTEDTEVALRNQTFRAKPVQAALHE